MGWKDNLQPASFKGAAFWVDSTSYSVGRRVSVRRLVGFDGSLQEDLGREPDEVEINAYLFGEDYDELRDDLEGVLAEGGPGVLVLPMRGERWARVVGAARTSEDRDKLGFCTVRFSVVIEDRSLGSLRTRPDTRSEVRVAAARVRSSSSAEFTTRYSARGMPDRYMRPAATALAKLTGTLRTMQAAVATVTGGISAASAALDELGRALNDVLSTPSDLVTHIVDAVESVVSIADTTRTGLDRLTGLPSVLVGPFERAASARATLRLHAALSALSAPTTGATTELGRRGDSNALAVTLAARTAGLVRAAETYAVCPFDSSALALEALSAVTDEVDALQLLTTSDDTYAALADLRAALARHLTETAGRLPQLIRHTVRDPLPALLVAHELYGDARMDADLLARNPGQHPLAMVGELEALQP